MICFCKKYLLVIISFAIVAYISFANFSDLPKSPSLQFLSDKIVHGIMYCFIMATILYSLRKTPVRISKILLISLIPVFYGAAIEIMQGALTSYRSNDVMDFAANVVGVYVAVGGYYLVKITKLFEHK